MTAREFVDRTPCAIITIATTHFPDGRLLYHPQRWQPRDNEVTFMLEEVEGEIRNGEFVADVTGLLGWRGEEVLSVTIRSNKCEADWFKCNWAWVYDDS